MGLTSISRTNNFGLNPSPTNGAVAATGAMGIPNDGFYSQVVYRGAFQPGQTETWMHGWTALYRLGVLDVSASSPQLSFLTPETPEFIFIDEINGRLCMTVEDQQESYVTPKLYLQCTDSLTSPNWQTIQVIRNGCDVKSVLAKVGDPARFYRIIRAH
ncbi:MAG: hypothetical protein HC841_01825 [Verrucomicrobiae bacterium]|nr:hypothetical protein [Verrucomicrobiae bacterium]